MIYEGEPGEESLDGIQTADGFIEWRGSAANSQMQYFLRDHLGSVRVIASDRHNVISRSDYLPFGVRMTGNGLTGESTTTRSSYFGFSGKENEMWDALDAMSGNTPHWLKGERYQHFGARAYDPVTCIFMQIDPMAEKYYGMTPYHYCAGNPVMLVDPDGKKIKIGSFIGRVLASLGINNYEKKVNDQLQELKKIDTNLAQSIEAAENSDKNYSIEPVNKRKDKKTGNGYCRTNSTLYFDPENDTTPSGKKRNPIVGLAHEFGHLDDDENDVPEIEIDRDKINAGDKEEIDKLERKEQRSLEFENIVREYLGLELRPRYFTN